HRVAEQRRAARDRVDAGARTGEAAGHRRAAGEPELREEDRGAAEELDEVVEHVVRGVQVARAAGARGELGEEDSDPTRAREQVAAGDLDLVQVGYRVPREPEPGAAPVRAAA